MYRVAWMATLAIACTGTPSSDPTPPGAKVIRIAGSSSLTTRLLPALAEEYTRLHPNVRFEVNRTQSGAGIRSLLEGEVDLAAAGRSHHPSEQEQALADVLNAEAEAIEADIALIKNGGAAPKPRVFAGKGAGAPA